MSSPKDIIDELEDRVEGAASTVWSGAKSVALILFLGGWSSLWGLLLLIGWIAAWPKLLITSGVVLLVTALSVFAGRWSRRRKLAARAEEELLAKAKLEGLKLDRNLEEVLGAFDVNYGRARRYLADATEVDAETAAEAEARLEAVRDKLYAVAKSKVELLRDLKKLGRQARLDLVRDTIEEARRDITGRQREAERMADDARRLTERLASVRQIGARAGGTADAADLRQVIDGLERTESAYQEIERVENETQRKLQALRAKQRQRG